MFILACTCATIALVTSLVEGAQPRRKRGISPRSLLLVVAPAVLCQRPPQILRADPINVNQLVTGTGTADDRDAALSHTSALRDEAAERRVRLPIHWRGSHAHQQNTITLSSNLIDPSARSKSHSYLAACHAQIIHPQPESSRLKEWGPPLSPAAKRSLRFCGACHGWRPPRRMHSYGSATRELDDLDDGRRSITCGGVMGDHLVVLHSAVRACAGYSRHDAPSILLDGSSVARDTEHGRAITAQLTRRHGTLEEAIDAAVFALGTAGLSKGIRRQARAACEDYFYSRLDLTPSHELGGRGDIVDSLELMPEPMYRALEHVVDLVVDGEYEELRVASGGRLRVEDLRRRVEDDCPESLVLPPREVYRVEAIAKSDDPDLPGWAYFLDLWTETGPARLHIEGELEESGERFTATLNDILP